MFILTVTLSDQLKLHTLQQNEKREQTFIMAIESEKGLFLQIYHFC